MIKYIMDVVLKYIMDVKSTLVFLQFTSLSDCHE